MSNFSLICADNWWHNAEVLKEQGINPDIIGKKVKLDNGHYGTIAGLKPQNRKMPFIITYMNGTKAKKMDIVAFKRTVGIK